MGPFDLAASLGASASAVVGASADTGGGGCIDLNMGFGASAAVEFGTSFVWHLTPPEGSRSIRIFGSTIWENTKCMEQLVDAHAVARDKKKKSRKKIHWGFGKHFPSLKKSWAAFRGRLERTYQERLRFLVMVGMLRGCTEED